MAKKKKQNQDVVFRRIRGRIVPIRRKKSSNSRKTRGMLEGAGIVAGSIGIAAGSGFVGGKLAQTSAKLNVEATKFMQTGNILQRFTGLSTPSAKAQHAKAIRTATQKVAKSEKLLKASSKSFKLGTNIFAGAVAGAGLEKFLESGLNRELSIGEEVSTDVAGVGLVLASKTGFTRGLTGKSMVRRGLKKILTRGKL